MVNSDIYMHILNNKYNIHSITKKQGPELHKFVYFVGKHTFKICFKHI